MAEAPDATEIRVVACLVEKQRTTPDVYPLSLNSLRIACNQATNRDPVVDYDEATVTEALRHLALRGWTRLASGPGGRARKYRHLLDDALGVDAPELSLLAVLMLRGVQTPGELKQRTERLHSFADLAAVEEVLERLIERDQVARLPRRPGQKEERYKHLLGGEPSEEERAPGPPPGAAEEGGPEPVPGAVEERIATPAEAPETEAESAPLPLPGDRLNRLEAELAELRKQVASLREALGE